ncbi:protein disulfide isomerase [Leishmania major strain Friedlin]|uniref:Protein disulfide-isomerase n=2 Tax=Leishmania TaxID=38568 RepID=Q4Q059_LEIMA|nr:protein disulfide isomerase [Leishmania major strain Friedlin]ANQ46674.1 protein disulfide isomerase [Leishmania tropica]CAG9584263.1 protein_disulfide_isomerase_2 [Leishmania major strain Friedlin]CAJ09676.1 protein disulfide isomerase [Leishmania major strain Friedlin]|eukprot:XP_001687289.1 protein disulfide isomerase [Leishmania major strain Friedlin]
MQRSFLVFVLCALLFCVASAEVQVATKDNFDKVVSGDLTLVKFYAPWCGHCKTLAPEFVKAADMLAGIATLAEVDCTKEESLAEKYEIKGFPTLYIFRNGEKVKIYDGPRTAAGIASYMKAHVGPSMKAISTAEELEELKKETFPVCVVKTASTDSEMASMITKVADSLRSQMNFVLVTDAAISPNDAMESVTVYRKNAEREAYTGATPMTAESVKSFLTSAVLDYFGELGQESFQKYMEANKDKPLGWVFIDKNTDSALKGSLVAVAEKYRSQVLLTYIDGDQYRPVSRQLGIPEDAKFPAFVVDFERRHHVMGTDTPVTSESVAAFVEKYVKGETKQTVMSDAIPAKETVNGLTTVVGQTFAKYTDGTQNVMLLFYAPWCGHCKKLHPVYDKVAKSFESENVIIAKMDATTNDFDREKFEVSGFPTIYFIPAGKPPIVYEGGRTADEIQVFVKSHLTASAAPSGGPSGNSEEEDL